LLQDELHGLFDVHRFAARPSEDNGIASRLPAGLTIEEFEQLPDVSFFSPAKAELADVGLRVQRFVPDLAIEIVSKRDRLDALFD
jgi:hypothetical protein